MASYLEDLAVLHREDAVGVDDCRKTMGDHDYCRLASVVVGPCQSLYRILDHPLAVGVKGGSGLIEDDDFRLPHQGSSDADPLSLTSTQVVAFLPNNRQELLGETLWIAQKLHATSPLGCFLNICLRISLESIYNIFLDVARKESGILVNQPDLFPQVNCVNLMLLIISIANSAFPNGIKLLNKFNDGGLTRATLPHKSNILSCLNGKRQFIQCNRV